MITYNGEDLTHLITTFDTDEIARKVDAMFKELTQMNFIINSEGSKKWHSLDRSFEVNEIVFLDKEDILGNMRPEDCKYRFFLGEEIGKDIRMSTNGRSRPRFYNHLHIIDNLE